MPHDFGTIALAVSIVSFASAIAPAALGEALIQRLHIQKSHLDTVFWICTGFALISYVVLIVFSPFISEKIGQSDVAKFMPLLGLKLLFDLFAVVPNSLIARAMSFHLIALRTIIATVISSVICVCLLFNGYGIWALAISLISTSIVTCITAFLGAKWLPGTNITKKAFLDLYKYGLFASGNRVLQVISLDQLIIGATLGTAPLGLFNFARRLFQMINDVIAGALTSVSHTLLASLQNDKEKVRDAFLMATYGSSLVSFPAFAGLAAIAGDAIPLIFGAQWSDAIWPTRWFCIIGLMSCIGVIQASLITSQGKSNWWFYYQLFRQILTITTLVLLYNRGVTIFVFAMAAQVVMFWPITLIMVSRIIDMKISTYFHQFIETFFASALMLASIILMAKFVDFSNPTQKLVSEIGIGAAMYVVFIFILSKEKVFVILKMIVKKKRI
jgi:O-antigen/teichoic acid export membrane protein